MELTLDVRPLGPVMDEIPDGARVALTDEDIARIQQLAGVVQGLGTTYGRVYGIELWDAAPRWLSCTDQEGPEAEHDMEIVMLHVTADEFYWTAYVRHSDTRVETAQMRICDLRASVPQQTEEAARVAV